MIATRRPAHLKIRPFSGEIVAPARSVRLYGSREKRYAALVADGKGKAVAHSELRAFADD
jgi:hypothetical protein